MYKEEELKLVYSEKTGQRRKVGPNIYNNPFRMRAGGWKFVQEPVSSCTSCQPVSINVPLECRQPEAPQIEKISTEMTSDPFSLSDRVYSEKIATESSEFSESTSTETPSYEIPELGNHEAVVPEPVATEPEQKRTQTSKNKNNQKSKSNHK